MEIRLKIDTEKMKEAGFEITENYTIEEFLRYEKSLLKTIEGEHIPLKRRETAMRYFSQDMQYFIDAVEAYQIEREKIRAAKI